MESTLALKLQDLAAEVGDFLGWGRGTDGGDSAWTTRQETKIRAIVSSGRRQFYFPPPLSENEPAYEWSFLRPVASFTLATGESILALPDDFGGLQGPIVVSSSQQTGLFPIDTVGDVRADYALVPTITGRPQKAALEPTKETTATKGQRFQLYVFPIADAEYTLQVRYNILPNLLTDSSPYDYGGAAHSETILESCLAIAEERQDDARSVHAGKFIERLAASISYDRKLKPQRLGYNGDYSDHLRRDPRSRREWWAADPITFGGVEPS